MNPQLLSQIIKDKAKKAIPKNIAYEFQEFGVRLAHELGDLRRKSYYIKLSKQVERQLLERARDHALGYHKPKSKAKIFMWFLKELKAPKTQIANNDQQTAVD